MKFKNKNIGIIVETDVKEVENLYKNKSEYEEVKEVKTKELTKDEIRAKLEELGIEYDKNANKETLNSLLPQE